MQIFYVFLTVAFYGSALGTLLQKQQTDFGLRVFSEAALNHPGQNFAMSPYGIASVMGMVQLGAYGSTLKTLKSHMGYSLQGKNSYNTLQHGHLKDIAWEQFHAFNFPRL